MFYDTIKSPLSTYQTQDIGSVLALFHGYRTPLFRLVQARNDRIWRVISRDEYFTARSNGSALFAEFKVQRGRYRYVRLARESATELCAFITRSRSRGTLYRYCLTIPSSKINFAKVVCRWEKFTRSKVHSLIV